MNTHFSPQTASALGHYVYALSDPREGGGIFYIGKGVRQRCFEHAALVESSEDFPKQRISPDLKRDTIRSILDAGLRPDVQIVAHALRDDNHALEIEAILIQAFGLANKQAGHHTHKYWQSLNQLEEKYGQPITRDEIPGSVLLVNLNRTYPSAKEKPEALALATLGDWGLAPQKGEKIDYIIGVYRGLMVSFYKIDKQDGKAVMYQTNQDNRPKRARRRYKWVGQPDATMKAVFKDRALVDLTGQTLSTFQRNIANVFLP